MRGPVGVERKLGEHIRSRVGSKSKVASELTSAAYSVLVVSFTPYKLIPAQRYT